MYRYTRLLLLASMACWLYSCREEYNPPAIQTDYNYLVVEGSLILNRDSSFFQLSRTQVSSGNTNASAKKERGAVIQVLNEAGNTVIQSVEKGNGQYAIFNGALSSSQNYRVKILTTGGAAYQSDLITPKITPAIDNVNWAAVNDRAGIQFYVNTHDPAGTSRYYRWEAEETWEYHAFYESFLMYTTDDVISRPDANQIFRCYRSQKGTEISIATSAALTEDFISQAPVFYIGKGTDKLNWKYSLLVTQHAISEDAYEYWQNLKKMTEQGGTIFDVQPTELIGNIHCLTNPDEPTIGYISINTITQSRIFVVRDEVPDFVVANSLPCDLKTVANNPLALRNAFSSGAWIPIAYGMGTAPPPVEAAPRECADCTYYGGTTTKPTFW